MERFQWLFLSLKYCIQCIYAAPLRTYAEQRRENKILCYGFKIILVLLALSSVVLYDLGKRFLIKRQNHCLDYASVFFIHPIILLLLYLAVQSEATMISAINWFIDLIQNLAGVYENFSNGVYHSFALHALLTFFPYVCLVLGLYKQKKAEDTQSQVRASE